MSPEPKRILMTADTVGGVWCYALALAEALQDAGTEILLATMGAPLSASQKRQLHRLSNVQVAESRYKLEWMPQPWADVKAAGDWLLDLAGQFRPDVVHLNGYSHATLPWDAPVLVVAHSCVLSWWRAVHGKDAPGDWNIYRRKVTAGLHAADLVIAPSHDMLRAILAHYGALRRSQVISNAIQFDKFSPGQKQHFVFCAGRLWDEAKNVRAVCAVAPEISWPVVLAGECTGPDGRRVPLPNVRCLGQVPADEMPDWFGRASIYAHPARYEPFGLSVLEAALSGCALVLGDIPSLRENWEGAALFVPPNDERELNKALRELIAEPRLVTELRTRALATARRFSVSRMARQYGQAYESLHPRLAPTSQPVPIPA